MHSSFSDAKKLSATALSQHWRGRDSDWIISWPASRVVNSLLVPYILSAIRMYESGFAAAEDIDTGMVEGCNHPMGPLRLADLIGLDTCQAVADSLYAEFKEPLYSSPPLLSRMVEAGLLGRKAGRGFYDYSK